MQDNGGLRRGGREEREEIPSPPVGNATGFLLRKQEFFPWIEKNFSGGKSLSAGPPAPPKTTALSSAFLQPDIQHQTQDLKESPAVRIRGV